MPSKSIHYWFKVWGIRLRCYFDVNYHAEMPTYQEGTHEPALEFDLCYAGLYRRNQTYIGFRL